MIPVIEIGFNCYAFKSVKQATAVFAALSEAQLVEMQHEEGESFFTPHKRTSHSGYRIELKLYPESQFAKRPARTAKAELTHQPVRPL